MWFILGFTSLFWFMIFILKKITVSETCQNITWLTWWWWSLGKKILSGYLWVKQEKTIGGWNHSRMGGLLLFYLHSSPSGIGPIVPWIRSPPYGPLPAQPPIESVHEVAGGCQHEGRGRPNRVAAAGPWVNMNHRFQWVEQRMETWIFTLKYTGFPDVTPPWTKNYGKVMVSSFQVQMDIGTLG